MTRQDKTRKRTYWRRERALTWGWGIYILDNELQTPCVATLWYVVVVALEVID